MSDIRTIPNIGQNNLNASEQSKNNLHQKKENKSVRDLDSVTFKTARDTFAEGFVGADNTESDNVNTIANGTEKTEALNLPKSSQGGVEIIQPSDSPDLLKISDVAMSNSMSLLDESAKHLYSLMKGLSQNTNNDVRFYDVERVQAACGCASQIRELLKLKLEAIRVSKAV